MTFNIPTLLTILRILAIPFVVLFFYLEMPLTASTIFGLAGLTDFIDGYLARKYDQESRFRAFLDPVADKLLVAVALLLVVEREATMWITLAAIIIISREITISALESGWQKQVNAVKLLWLISVKLKLFRRFFVDIPALQ